MGNKSLALLKRIQDRTETPVLPGRRITTADAYVRRAVDEMGIDRLQSMFPTMPTDRELILKEAQTKLVYCDERTNCEDTQRIEKTASTYQFKDFLPEGVKPPAHTLMLLKYVLTGPVQDHDGDVLRTEGAKWDPRGPLLWQHMMNSLVGKYMGTIQQPNDTSRLKLPLKDYLRTANRETCSLKEVAALLDLNEFTEDIAKMVEADALRFSQGFKAVGWEEIKVHGGGVSGFDVSEYYILERSFVSVPSCDWAVMELFSRQKFHSDPIKYFAKSIYDSRPALVRGFCLKHSVLPSVTARIPEKALRAVADADERQPIRWAKSMPECFDRLPRMEGDKLFDPAGEMLKAATLMHDWVSKYLEVPVKRICESHASIPGAKMGAWLTALDAKLTGAQVDDVRNISGDVERPPQYEAIQLTSVKSDTFLVDGTRFARFPEMKCVLAVEPAYFGLHATLYTDLDSRDANIKFFNNVQQTADEYKFLKGEAFSLSGDFLTRDGSTMWDDVFLAKKNETAVRHATAMLEEKGAAMPSRGVLMLGPPGSGKTMSGRAMMNECKDATFIWVAARDFYMCGSFGGFSYAFDMAKELAPSIIFFEDVDNWMRDTAIDLLKTEMDGLTQNKGILTVLTTNHPEQLPKALIDRPGRFHDVLLFDNPTEAVRDTMIARWLPDADEKQRAAAVKRTDGWSGAHVYELCAYAKGTAEQDKLETGEALVKSLDKIAEQRDLIDEVQGRRSRYEPMAWERAVTDLWLKGAKYSPEQPRADDGKFGEGGGGDRGDSSGSKITETAPYREFASSTIKISDRGQLKIRKPKSVDEALSMMDAMDKIMSKASEEFERAEKLPASEGTAKFHASMRMQHVSQQFKRVLKMAQDMAPKGIDKLRSRIAELSKKWGLKPADEIGEDPELDLSDAPKKSATTTGLKVADEAETEETEEPTMLVCDKCGHEMKAPADYDAEKPMTCPECKEGKMMPKEEAEEAEDEPAEDKSADVPAVKTIREVDGEFCVFSEEGKNLGCHPTREEAVEHLGAIEANKTAEPTAPIEPAVGDTVPTEVKADGDMMVCEDCGHEMPADEAGGETECPKCGGMMKPMGEKSATSVIAKAVADLICPTCADKMTTKAGRVLSQRNMDGLSEAAADLEEALDIEKVPRKCAALVERALKRLTTVIESAQPINGDESRPDARPKEPAGTNGKTLAEFLATAEVPDLRRVQEILVARLEVIDRDARADELKAQGLI